MTTARFRSGALLSLKGKNYSLLRVIGENVWQLEEHSSRRIFEYSKNQLLEMFSRKELQFLQQADQNTTQAILVSDNAKELTAKAKTRYACMKAIEGLPATRAIIEPVIKRAWEKIGQGKPCPTFSTVCRWSSKYQEGGKTPIRLIDQHHRRGNRRRRYPSEVIRISQETIERTYMTNERNTLETTLEEAQREVILENKRLPSSDQLPIPTRRLVHSLIQGIRADDRCVARYGRDAAMKQFRAMLAHRLTDQPLERAEIDHTVLDIMVVDNETGMPLGRPFLTACIDDNTRSVLGIHVGFTPPSYLSVAKCLQHAFLPKSNLKDGNPDLVNDWTAFGVMRELVVDNGAEFHSDSLENTCFLLGIELHYSARKTPWFKGKIERFLGSLNRGVAHGNPGTTFGDIFEKGDYDPKKNAVIRLDALRRAIHLWIVDYYHQKPHSVLKMSPEDAWRSRIALEDIRLPADVQMMDAIVGKSLERVLTHKGIEYNKLFYNSAELKELRSRMGSRLDVDIRVNTENIGQIHVISPDKRNTFVVPAIDYEYAEGMTEWQHELCKKYAARHMHRYDDKNGWLDAKEKIRRIFGTEKQWKKQTVRRQKAAAKKERMGNDTEQTDLPQSSSDEYQPALHAPTATELSMPNQETYEPVEPRTPKRFGAIQQTRHQYFLNTETLK